MANAIDFIGTVYDTLAKTLNIDNSSNAEFIQMAWPGYALSAADFKPANAPDGPYDPDIAKEAFSHIANIAPLLSKLKFENSGYEIDDLYEILLTSAIPLGATQDTVAANPLYHLFSDAQYEFLQARRGSVADPNQFYYPCNATPANWYDDSASAFWPALEVKSNQVQPASTASSAFVKAGGLVQAKKGIWKLRPGAMDEASIRKDVDATLLQKAQFFKPVPAAVQAAPLILRSKPLNSNVLAASKAMAMMPVAAPLRAVALGAAPVAAPVSLQARALNPGFTRTPEFVNSLRLSQSATLFNVKNVPVNAMASPSLQVEARKMNLATRTMDLRTPLSLNLAHRFLLKDVIEAQLPDQLVSNTSDGFSITFKFCRVNIDRSWFKLALLSNKNWYMANTAAQEYSTGRADENPGMFPLLPVSFIVIRDLKITANWSAQDQTAIQNSVSFGPFDLTGGSVQQNTLEVKGMQIIAWVSKLMPPLPPAQGA